MSTSVPGPACVTPPAPDITGLNSTPCVRVSDRLKARVAPAPTLSALATFTEPAVPPSPICSVPAFTRVVPVYVLVPPRTVVPAPDWITPPEPETTHPKSVPCRSVLDRLNPSAAPVPTLMLPKPVSTPVVPPLPSRSVPACTVVAPV